MYTKHANQAQPFHRCCTFWLKRGSYSYSCAHLSAPFELPEAGRSCPLRCESMRAVWITDRMSSLCLEETTFWHLGEEWQHAVGLWRDIFLANEDTVKTHAHAHTDKQDGRQFVRADSARRRNTFTHAHTHTQRILTVGKIAGFRQHFHTSLSSSFLFVMTGPNGRVVWRTGERDAVNVHESGKCV